MGRRHHSRVRGKLLTVLVAGSFRLPPERIAEARAEMARVIEASLAEAGCRAYAYAEDIAEPGLFRVQEEWDSRAALEAHFVTPHMLRWQAERVTLGFHDRQVAAYEVAAPIPL
ncbi:MAG: putative quinol monooxygenase [Croceibacterium sp.]